MPDIVEQRECLDQIFVEPQGSANSPGQRCDLMGVSQTRSVIVPHIAGKDLHLAAQSPKRRAVKNSIAIPLKGTAISMLGLVVLPPLGIDRMHGIGGEQMPFSFLPRVSRLLIARHLHG